MNSETILREALVALDERFRECFGHPITAEEAYDSFYQDIVREALGLDSPIKELCKDCREAQWCIPSRQCLLQRLSKSEAMG